MVRILIVVAATVAVVAGVFLLPIRVPQSVVVQGLVVPAREWTVERDRDGSFSTVLRDHEKGTVESYALNRFERGDAVRLTMLPRIRPHASVSAGDTVASIFSTETERQLAQVTGELSTVMASLDLYASGEKEAIVEEARTQLSRAEEQARQHERILDRLRTLREPDAVSEQELEIAESQQRLYEADIAAARARLEVVQSGAKPQQLDLTRAEATALRDEIATLNERLRLLTVTSPISGIVARSFGSDTLLTVRDTSSYVVVMPVPWRLHDELRPGQTLDVELPGSRDHVEARMLQLGDTIRQLNGEPVLLVTASFDYSTAVLPGAAALCTLLRDSVSLPEYLRRFALSIFR